MFLKLLAPHLSGIPTSTLSKHFYGSDEDALAPHPPFNYGYIPGLILWVLPSHYKNYLIGARAMTWIPSLECRLFTDTYPINKCLSVYLNKHLMVLVFAY